MRTKLTMWLAAAAVSITATADARPPKSVARPAVRTVIVYTGEVNDQTVDRFLNTISNNVDKVIGVKVVVYPGQDEAENRSGYRSSYDDEQLVISQTGPTGLEGGIEVVKNGPADRMMGGYSIDGMFIVKPGGTHQGVSSFGLLPVDEAAVRLNPAVRIVERSF